MGKNKVFLLDLLQTTEFNIQGLLLKVVSEVRCQCRAGSIQSCHT